MSLVKDKPVVKVLEEEVVEFTPFDPWTPVLKSGTPSLHTTPEQDLYIREILEICCSDSAFAKKAYAALQYILTGAAPVAPTVTSLSPATAVIGDPVFDIHVHGTGFNASSIITFNGLDEPTTFVSETELTTGINMPLWVSPAVVPVAVKNGDLVSEPLDFEFTAPVLLSAPSVKSKDEGYKGQEKK
jgi:hypothetical protein